MDKKILFILIFFMFSACFIALNSVDAQGNLSNWSDNLKNSAGDKYIQDFKINGQEATTKQKVADYIGGVITIIPFLGILLIMHATFAGYEWMTAAGNADKVEKARKRLTFSILGAIIMATIYVMAIYIIDLLSRASGYKI